MKKQFKYLSILLLLFVGFVSCDTDDETELPTSDVEGYVYLQNRRISTLDQNADLQLKLFAKDGVQIQSISIEDADGNVIATPTITGDNMATFNSSVFGDLSGNMGVRVVSVLSNGKIANDYASITVYDAVELGENPTSVSLDSLATTKLSYEVTTFSAEVDNVDLFLKKNAAGTYMNTNLDLSTAQDSVLLGNTNYENLNLAVNDTLYYKFAATSGAVTKDAEGMIAIE